MRTYPFPETMTPTTERQDFTLLLDLYGTARAFAFILGGVAALLTPPVVFKLMMELGGGRPTAVPGSWLYDLGGAISSGIWREGRATSAGLDYGLLVTFEVLLMMLVLAGAILFVAQRLRRDLLFAVWVRTVDAAPFVRLAESAAIGYEAARIAGERFAHRAAAGVEAVDWQRLRQDASQELNALRRGASHLRSRTFAH